MKEADQILHALMQWQQNCVLATIVKVEGSSYRKAGAMMLLGENGAMTGAVSGGCIEKEIAARAATVFADKKPLLMQYDGRYVLGCNGTLHIFLEFIPYSQDDAVFSTYFNAYKNRNAWGMITDSKQNEGRSFAVFDGDKLFSLNNAPVPENEQKSYLDNYRNFKSTEPYQDDQLYREITPPSHLIIIGNELDSIKLATLATQLDYLVTIVSHPRNPNLATSIDDILHATIAPEEIATSVNFDSNTAIALMTHSYSRDLAYLQNLISIPEVAYFGMIGPKQRGNDIFMELVELGSTIPNWLENRINYPAGLDLGGELPSEVALSILSQIQTHFTGHNGKSLHDKQSGIHFKSRDED